MGVLRNSNLAFMVLIVPCPLSPQQIKVLYLLGVSQVCELNGYIKFRFCQINHEETDNDMFIYRDMLCAYICVQSLQFILNKKWNREVIKRDWCNFRKYGLILKFKEASVYGYFSKLKSGSLYSLEYRMICVKISWIDVLKVGHLFWYIN